jgi:hypothetical protein
VSSLREFYSQRRTRRTRFRWEGFETPGTSNHLVGAALMGFGGVT